jgi:GH43 family beta-xylosidase
MNGSYYYSDSDGLSIYVRKSATLLDLATATPVKVWSAPSTGPNSRDVWAPELHQIAGHWYLYYAADDGDNNNHRLFALTASGADPQGAYTEAVTGKLFGQIADPVNHWAIDPNVFTAANGSLYMVWSCTNSSTSAFPQSTCLAAMSDALHLSGSPVQISTPLERWETRTAAIQEGPVGFVHGGKTFITYSGSASWTTDYAVGLLTNSNGTLLTPSSWVKSGPIFDHHDTAYGPGSVVFVPSTDGTEIWNVYHGIDRTNCRPNAYTCRDVRMQQMWWSPDGSPLLGYPVDPSIALAPPSTSGASDRTARSWGDAFGDAAEGLAGGKQTGTWVVNSTTGIVSGTSLGTGWKQTFQGSSPDYENYVVQADVQWVQSGTSSSSPRYGIYAGYADARNYVSVWIDPFARKLLSYGVINGKTQTWQSLALPASFDPIQYHTLSVEKAGLNPSTFTFSVDGIRIGSRAFDLFNGQVGLVTEDSKASFRNVSLSFVH